MFKKLIFSLTLFSLSLAPAFGSCETHFFSESMSGCVLSPEYTLYQKEQFVGLEGKVGLFSTGYREGFGIRIGVEKSLESSLKGAKFGFEGRTEMTSVTRDFFLVFGANFVHHWGEGEKEWKFAPEIGIGWPYVSVVYQYGLHMSGDKIENIGNHGVTLSINIPF